MTATKLYHSVVRQDGPGWGVSPTPVHDKELMRIRHSDKIMGDSGWCLRCWAQTVAAVEWGFSGVSRYDRPHFRSDYECILEQIAAERIVARREEDI